MSLSNVLILSQVAGHVIKFILSLCVTAPLSIHLHSFNGHCLLFSTGTWQPEDGLFNVSWASRGFCNFPIATGVILMIVSLAQIYRLSRLAYKQEESSFLSLFLDVLVGIVLCAFCVISAVFITLGFIVWCSQMTQRFPSCEITAGQNITKENEKINTSGFYIEMGTAQFGAWGSFAIMVGISVIALLKLINNHQTRNIKVSMYLERQRLMNEDMQNNSSEGRSTPPLEQAQTSEE